MDQVFAELEAATYLPSDDDDVHIPDMSVDMPVVAQSSSSPQRQNLETNQSEPEQQSSSNNIPSHGMTPKLSVKKTRKSPRLSKDKNKAKLKTLPKPIKKPKKVTKIKKMYFWKKCDFSYEVTIPDSTFTTPNSVLSPLEYFKRMFDDDIAKLIVNYTNLYSVQTTGTSINLTVNELWDFISILLIMGVMKLPNYVDYWSREWNVPQISSKMSLKKFRSIRRFLRFCDNSLYDPLTEIDRFFKIRPFVEKLRENFLKIEPENNYSVDEMMIPHKGKRCGSIKQYMPKKPKKWGFKVFVRCGTSGIAYDFILYGGESTFFDKTFSPTEEALFGVSAKFVVALCQTIQNIPAAVYCDNFFTSLELIEYLREEKGILCVGTINQNRLRNLQFTSDKELMKKGRGSFEQYSDNKNKLCVVKWADTIGHTHRKNPKIQ